MSPAAVLRSVAAAGGSLPVQLPQRTINVYAVIPILYTKEWREYRSMSGCPGREKHERWGPGSDHFGR